MKKTVSVLLTLILCLVIITGCTCKQNLDNADTAEEDNSQYSLETMKYMPEFSCTDINGNPVSNDVFKDYKLTLINLWGTWCGPCIAELPDLQKASERLAEKSIQVISICEDAEAELELAKEILEENGVAFTTIVPDAKLTDDFVSLCHSFPSNIVVNSDGDVVKNVFSGAHDADGFVKIMEELLEKGADNAVPNSSSKAAKNKDDTISGDALDRFYAKLKSNTEKAEKENGVNLEQRKKNTELLSEYHRKAMEYCGDSFVVESKITSRERDDIVVKNYFSHGSWRMEEYHGEGIRYVEVYNSDENTYHFLDVESGAVDKVTKAVEKGYQRPGLCFGYFPVYGYNAASGTITEESLNGRKVIFCEHNNVCTSRVWIDADTGIMLKAEQLEGKTVVFSDVPDLKVGVELDKSLFEFDKTKPDAGREI